MNKQTIIEMQTNKSQNNYKKQTKMNTKLDIKRLEIVILIFFTWKALIPTDLNKIKTNKCRFKS